MNERTHTEFDTKDELMEKRKGINSFKELTDFLKDIELNYNRGYGDTPRAIAQACLAVGWYLSRAFGITGFQASIVMWDFILGWQKTGNKTSLKLVDYDDMLYPQYSYKFERTMPKDTWEAIQKAAKELLNEAHKTNHAVHPEVYCHWKSIASGNIPFGYGISD